MLFLFPKKAWFRFLDDSEPPLAHSDHPGGMLLPPRPMHNMDGQVSPLAAHRHAKNNISYCVNYLFNFWGLDYSRDVKYRNGVGLKRGSIVPRGICALDWTYVPGLST